MTGRGKKGSTERVSAQTSPPFGVTSLASPSNCSRLDIRVKDSAVHKQLVCAIA